MLRFVVLSIALAFSGFLASAVSAQSKFDGFYIGGQGWYSTINVDLSVSGLGSVDDDLDGFGGGGFVGWGFTNKHTASNDWGLYGAIEGEIGFNQL